MSSCRTIFVSKRKLLLSREYWALFHGSENDMKCFLRGNWERFHKKITESLIKFASGDRKKRRFGRKRHLGLLLELSLTVCHIRHEFLRNFDLLLLLNYFFLERALI